MKAVDTSTPKVYSCNDPKSPISQAIPDLIKEKRRLRQLYNNTQDPNIKSTINKLQKEIRTKINQESTISWEKFCNSTSNQKAPVAILCPNYVIRLPKLTLKRPGQLFSKSVKRKFGIESHLFHKSHHDHVNKFVEAHSYHFTPLD